MDFAALLELVGDDPVFETGLLLAGPVDQADVRRQLSRWTKAGRLHQYRRGVYSIAPPFQKVRPHPFLVANRMVRGSYVSLHSALAYYGLIPEAVVFTTSVAAARPCTWETPIGSFLFRHIKPELLFGYALTDMGAGQRAFVARPEKALLDLAYLRPGGDGAEYLRGLRLQNFDCLDIGRLQQFAERAGIPKLIRAAVRVAELARAEALEYRSV